MMVSIAKISETFSRHSLLQNIITMCYLVRLKQEFVQGGTNKLLSTETCPKNTLNCSAYAYQAPRLTMYLGHGLDDLLQARRTWAMAMSLLVPPAMKTTLAKGSTTLARYVNGIV